MPDTTTTENKVQFNLKNAHYAVKTASGYGTPKAVPGSVALNLNAVGEITPFYADGVVYYNASSNNGYEGDWEVAKIPDQMLQDIWGYTLGTTSKVLTENANVEPAEFAFLFQIDGDEQEEYYVLYNCTATRPGIASETNKETKEPHTQTSTIKAVPGSDGHVFARTTKDTPTATKTGWFTSVFVEGTTPGGT